MEEGRRVACDIAGSDPKRMSAPPIVECEKSEFASTSVVMMQVREIDICAYPLMAAVNRAASGVERHNEKVVHLTYEGASPADTTLFLIGKGITYDTVGMDVKAGGVMAGMHRDKSRAAAVAGCFRIFSLLKPKGLSVHGAMALVRNSIGSNGYVADMIITSCAGRLVYHDLDLEKKHLPYTHLDIAGSAGGIDVLPSGAPLLMFTSMYVLPRL
ncbi:putative aminopeptidase W07G4.4 [Echinococcus granulosus]|nr:putative aminopeptidase W07G4.4 [Echinococcus granulosus]